MLSQTDKEKLWDLMNRVYWVAPTGGGAHIVLDDQNIDTHSVEFCIPYTKENIDDPYEKRVTLECLEALLPLSEEDRLDVILEFHGITKEEYENRFSLEGLKGLRDD
jgi:hypothetical protein